MSPLRDVKPHNRAILGCIGVPFLRAVDRRPKLKLCMSNRQYSKDRVQAIFRMDMGFLTMSIHKLFKYIYIDIYLHNVHIDIYIYIDVAIDLEVLFYGCL